MLNQFNKFTMSQRYVSSEESVFPLMEDMHVQIP